MSSNDQASAPPQPNPILTAYEGYVRDTPIVTRYALNTVALSFFASFFFSPAYALANIPLFTLFQFQLYRIVTAPLICSDFLSLIFAFFGFQNHGIRLEQAVGSASFATLLLTLSVTTNVLFLIIEVLLWGLTNNQGHLVSSSMGIWTVLLALIALECSNAPPDVKRRLFVIEVPMLYYPLAILALFSLFAGPRLSYCLSVAVGYALGYGKLDKWKVRPERVRRWEDGCLRNFAQRDGWVAGQAATGSGAWNDLTAGGGGSESGGGSSGGSVFRSGGGSTDGGGSGGPGSVSEPVDPAIPSFPSGGGRSLGGGGGARGLLSRGKKAPKTSEERAALLERAAERRRQQEQGGGGDQNV